VRPAKRCSADILRGMTLEAILHAPSNRTFTGMCWYMMFPAPRSRSHHGWWLLTTRL